MADQTVKINSCTTGTSVEMIVRPEIAAINAKETITFANLLEGGATAKVSFFDTYQKSQRINDFCVADMTDGYFEISGGQSKACTVSKYAKDGVPFYYMIETVQDSKNHQPLDPVIIIQPTAKPQSLFDSPVFITLVVPLLAVLIGFALGRLTAGSRGS